MRSMSEWEGERGFSKNSGYKGLHFVYVRILGGVDANRLAKDLFLLIKEDFEF